MNAKLVDQIMANLVLQRLEVQKVEHDADRIRDSINCYCGALMLAQVLAHEDIADQLADTIRCLKDSGMGSLRDVADEVQVDAVGPANCVRP
ncbi:MAG: hypothetical protein ACR2QH_03175 [Geminicoccaceae bacterium]